ncbi:hypothetical protein FIA58_020175 [Flavobacterium jejuense]|uniref:Haemolysin activator HlyB C-terminal domain-containing protein n=1 Tax=Flavobacterium jejuense TaxID=1544455 RepID=A0ABX0IZN7_9FLAO|nr:hypothetical protein [Flavobacterium jejuense]NHN28003.1 hypothetical protein [Flavobacterium jejuense]
MTKRIVLLFFLNLLFVTSCFSQKNTVKNDSVKIYHDIHKYSQKGKFSKFVYRLFFRSSKLSETVTKAKKPDVKNDLTKFNGKIIRNINIKSLDPFGYSINDSTKVPKNSFEKFGNTIHIKTKKFTVKNLLLFKKNDVFDNLAIKESERLIRDQRYIRRVIINPKSISASSDSIDVDVTLLDSWSILPNGSLSSNQGNFTLRERNLLGLGHQINGNYKERFSDGYKAKSVSYSINNIKNSYISFNAIYDNDFDNNSRRIVSINRSFFSALTKWAGGLYFENRLQNEPFIISADSIVTNSLKSEFQEYWIGRSFKISNKTDYNSRTKRLITSLAYNKKIYSQVATKELDPTSFFSNETNIISQIGIASQKYYKDSFIFNYDIVEDVPYGEIAAITVGLQNKNDLTRLYLGSKVSQGKKYSFGYLSNSVEWGSFFHNGNPYQNTLKIELNYFSPLFQIGKWKTRQFIKPSYIWGNNRDLSQKDLVDLEGKNGIIGFTDLLKGTQRWVLSLQTQTYSPGSWKGFRFSPYLNLTMGSISEKNENLLSSKVYSKIGIGLLINNDYLVFNSFQISFSYYPTIPFEGTNIIKTNSFENDDLSLPQFRLSKPYHIRYQ